MITIDRFKAKSDYKESQLCLKGQIVGTKFYKATMGDLKVCVKKASQREVDIYTILSRIIEGWMTPNLPMVYQTVKTPEGLQIITERFYMSFEKWLEERRKRGPIDPVEWKSYIFQIINVIALVHYKYHLIHGNLNFKNIMVLKVPDTVICYRIFKARFFVRTFGIMLVVVGWDDSTIASQHPESYKLSHLRKLYIDDFLPFLRKHFTKSKYNFQINKYANNDGMMCWEWMVHHLTALLSPRVGETIPEEITTNEYYNRSMSRVNYLVCYKNKITAVLYFKRNKFYLIADRESRKVIEASKTDVRLIVEKNLLTDTEFSELHSWK